VAVATLGFDPNRPRQDSLGPVAFAQPSDVVDTIEQWHLDARGEHEAVHNQLAAAIEHFKQGRLAVRASKRYSLSITIGSLRRSATPIYPSPSNTYSHVLPNTQDSAADTMKAVLA
jgi:hypothetical protein